MTLLKGKNFGGMPKILVLCSFLNILMLSDKMIHRVLTFHKTLFITKPKRGKFHFHYLPKLCTLASLRPKGFTLTDMA